MNGIEALLAVLVVYGIRDGVLAWWLIHRLLAVGAVAVAAPAGAQPATGAVAGPVVMAPAAKPKPRFIGIEATSFAGGNDSISSRTSAYDGKIINGDTELAAAVPGPVTAGRIVRVWFKDKSVDLPVRDKGPWNIHDAYWVTGARPDAETCHNAQRELSSGPNAGKVPSNTAGIDLTPAAWNALGVADGRNAKFAVDWDFADVLDGKASGPTPTASVAEPPWLTWARNEIGFHETGNNQGIERYIQLAHCGALGDPWCAIFANAALEASGVPGTRSPAARSFCTHPAFTKVGQPVNGDLAVFWRGSRDGAEGHVGFYLSEDATHVQALSGNENDQVEVGPIPKNGSTMGLLGYWRPNGIAAPKVT